MLQPNRQHIASPDAPPVSSQLLVTGLVLLLLRLQLQLVQEDLPVLVPVLVVEHVLDDGAGVHPWPQATLLLSHLHHDELGELEMGNKMEPCDVPSSGT